MGKRVTDFLDLNDVIHAVERNWFEGTQGQSNGKRILVADASAFSRGVIRGGLDMAGYEVLEAANLQDAMRSLEQHPVDGVVTALDLPPDGGTALLAALRGRPAWTKIPVLAIADSTEPVESSAARSAGFADCQAKSDQARMLTSLARLVSTEAAAEAVPAAV